jgi:hypothetical protein
VPLRETELRVDMNAFDLTYGSKTFAMIYPDYPGIETYRPS